jgi:hypothetical protein
MAALHRVAAGVALAACSRGGTGDAAVPVGGVGSSEYGPPHGR